MRVAPAIASLRSTRLFVLSLPAAVLPAASLGGEPTGDGGSWTPVELAMHYSGPLVLPGDIPRIVENGQPVYLLMANRLEFLVSAEILRRGDNSITISVNRTGPVPPSTHVHVEKVELQFK